MKTRRQYLDNNCCAECGHDEFSYTYETTHQEFGVATYSDGQPERTK